MRRCATTLEGDMTVDEHEFLLRVLRDGHFEGAHLEIGTAAGGTLCSMMRAFEDDVRPPFVVVDRMTYFPNQLATVRQNLTDQGLNPDTVDLRVATSNDAFRRAMAGREEFDFMLIDATHKIFSVMADLRWTRLISVGGVLCLHDYCKKFPGVRLAVDWFLRHHVNYEVIGQTGTLIAIRKTSAAKRREVGPLDRAYSVSMYLPLQIQRKANKWKTAKKTAA